MKEGRRIPIIDSVKTIRFAAQACLSLFNDLPTNLVEYRKPLFENLSRVPATEPLNREDSLHSNFLSILDARQIKLPVVNSGPYWMKNENYNLMEAIGTIAQFTDHHAAPLPRTTLPPAEDTERFINRVFNEPEPITVDRQFELLLDITNNNVIGAANLGMMATRYVSRFGDFRAYPNITI